MDHHLGGSLSEDLGGSLSDDHILRELMLPLDVPDGGASDGVGGAAGGRIDRIMHNSDAARVSQPSSRLRRTPSTLMTPVREESMVCPYQSRRRRLRRSCRENGLEVIRPLGRGSFGRIVLSRRERDGAYFALKLQRLTGSELTPEQVAAAMEHRASVRAKVDELPTGIVRAHFETALSQLDSKIKAAAPKEGEFRLFDGKQLRRSMAESVILDHLKADRADLDDGAAFVVHKHGTFEDREWMFIVLDYIEGGTLEDQLARCGGTMSEDTARFYLSEILMGLKYLRSRNVSHRDIKPANIMINAKGHCVLMDFGLSTRIEKGLQTFCGTAEYISPEVLTQKTWDAAALDTWSFGVLAHKLLTGVTPFEAETARDVFMQIIMSSNSPGPHANLSPEGHSLISSILARNPDDRPTIPEIMEHDWFAGVDWVALGRRQVVPPWVPSEASVAAMESGIIHL
jgi:serine/threonine protein kinase